MSTTQSSAPESVRIKSTTVDRGEVVATVKVSVPDSSTVQVVDVEVLYDGQVVSTSSNVAVPPAGGEQFRTSFFFAEGVTSLTARTTEPDSSGAVRATDTATLAPQEGFIDPLPKNEMLIENVIIRRTSSVKNSGDFFATIRNAGDSEASNGEQKVQVETSEEVVDSQIEPTDPGELEVASLPLIEWKEGGEEVTVRTVNDETTVTANADIPQGPNIRLLDAEIDQFGEQREVDVTVRNTGTADLSTSQTVAVKAGFDSALVSVPAIEPQSNGTVSTTISAPNSTTEATIQGPNDSLTLRVAGSDDGGGGGGPDGVVRYLPIQGSMEAERLSPTEARVELTVKNFGTVAPDPSSKYSNIKFKAGNRFEEGVEETVKAAVIEPNGGIKRVQATIPVPAGYTGNVSAQTFQSDGGKPAETAPLGPPPESNPDPARLEIGEVLTNRKPPGSTELMLTIRVTNTGEARTNETTGEITVEGEIDSTVEMARLPGGEVGGVGAAIETPDRKSDVTIETNADSVTITAPAPNEPTEPASLRLADVTATPAGTDTAALSIRLENPGDKPFEIVPSDVSVASRLEQKNIGPSQVLEAGTSTTVEARVAVPPAERSTISLSTPDDNAEIQFDAPKPELDPGRLAIVGVSTVPATRSSATVEVTVENTGDKLPPARDAEIEVVSATGDSKSLIAQIDGGQTATRSTEITVPKGERSTVTIKTSADSTQFEAEPKPPEPEPPEPEPPEPEPPEPEPPGSGDGGLSREQLLALAAAGGIGLAYFSDRD